MEYKEQAWQVCEQGVGGSGLLSLPLHRARCTLTRYSPALRVSSILPHDFGRKDRPSPLSLYPPILKPNSWAGGSESTTIRGGTARGSARRQDGVSCKEGKSWVPWCPGYGFSGTIHTTKAFSPNSEAGGKGRGRQGSL